MASSDVDLEELYRRAIADPKSITRAERNAINGWPAPEEEDRLCVAKTGRTRAELVAKALANPDDLTRDEAMILYDPKGVQFDAEARVSLQEMWERHQRNRADVSQTKALRDEAHRQLWEAMEEEEKVARRNAIERQRAIDDVQINRSLRLSREKDAARRLKDGTWWIRHMLENGLLERDAECWGFVVFRTGCYDGERGETAWRNFREHFEKVAKTSVLHWNSGPLIWPTFRTVFVEDKDELDGASSEQLRARFKKMREDRDGETGGQLPKGIRTNYFLVADQAAIESEAAQTPYEPRYIDDLCASVRIRDDDPVVYVRAVDPDWEEAAGAEGGGEEKSEDEMAGFKGEVTIALPRVFDWLHFICFNAERGTDPGPCRPTGRGWRTIYMQTRRPEAWVRNSSPSSVTLYTRNLPFNA